MHAQKDMSTTVLNDKTTTVKGGHVENVTKDQRLTVSGSKIETVVKSRTTRVHEEETLIVKNNISIVSQGAASSLALAQAKRYWVQLLLIMQEISLLTVSQL